MPMKHRTLWRCLGGALPGLLSGLALAAGEPPALPGKAEQALPLANGHWLTLSKRGVDLIDAKGRSRAHLDLRSKQMDLRQSAGRALAVVFDADGQRAIPLHIDPATATLLPAPALPATPFAVETLCQYRDAQGLDSVFLVGKDGRAEQWLLTGEQPQLLRRLALPPRTEHCRVDDATHTLFASEADFGVWAYPAEAEGLPSRQLVAARQPYGALPTGPGALAPLPGGLVVLASQGHGAYIFHQRKGEWTLRRRERLGVAVDPRQLAVAADASQPTLILRAADSRWSSHALAWHETPTSPPVLPLIPARIQTDPVLQQGDAADDPAIWIHPSDPSQSMVLATNKKQGLLRYDLQGRQRQLLAVGRINNVDLRQNLSIDGTLYDLAVATQRDENSLVLFAIDGSGQVSEAGRITTDLKDIYGICLYRPARGGLEVFANDKDGEFRHYRLRQTAGRFSAELLRRFALASQPEGCVADDANGRLFIGEEKRGVWVMGAEAGAPEERHLILPVGPRLAADVEGLTLYAGRYLLASSQGNNSYVVIDAQPPYRYRGAFRVGINVEAGIDGTSDTDGIDVTSVNLGGPFAQGMLVVQDGYKRLPEGPQNFKYIAWQDIARALALP